MIRVGILAGGGKLPLLIGKNLIQAKYDVMFFCIENFSDLKMYKDYKYEIISMTTIRGNNTTGTPRGTNSFK